MKSASPPRHRSDPANPCPAGHVTGVKPKGDGKGWWCAVCGREWEADPWELLDSALDAAIRAVVP